MKTVAIHTLGCKINQYESNLILQNLQSNGYKIVDFKDIADIYIVNTCTVTSEADRKSRQMVRQAKKRNPNARVIVTGCYSNLNPEKFEGFEIIKDKYEIITLLTNSVRFENLLKTSFDKSRFFIKIQDGCDKFCTYCRIPYARGHAIHSKPIELILNEIDLAVNSNYEEIVLTGINIGLYGKDIDVTLLDLLQIIESRNYNARFRISSIDPQDAYKILPFLRQSIHFVHHLHLSLQSGSDRILRLMNRGYSKDLFLRLLHALREIDNFYAVSTDIIVGFPSENVDSINDTLSILNEFEFCRVHIFPYSNRPLTLASKMNLQLSKQTIKNYLNIVNLKANESIKKYKSLLNGKEDYGIYVGDNNLLGEYYVPVEDSVSNKKSRKFVYRFQNGTLYAE